MASNVIAVQPLDLLPMKLAPCHVLGIVLLRVEEIKQSVHMKLE